MENLTPGLVAVALAIVGLATVAVLVSSSANTGSVISQSGSSFATVIQAAVSPVTGGSNLFGSVASGATGALVGSML